MLKKWFIVFCVLLNVSYAQVTADFSGSVTSGCSPLLVTFTDLSTGSITSWNWNLGNGNNSSLQNPGATYVLPGTYTVTLTVSDGVSNDTEVKTAYITVFANPTANFSASPTSGCLPLTVSFSDLSAPGSGAINQWFWDFGDGSAPSTQQSPTHIYTSAGIYTVSLIVTDVNGCTSTETKINYIDAFTGPTANFSAGATSSCSVPFNVNFINSSTGSGGLSYQWSFPGGTPASSTLQNPNITYNSAGSYNVSLIVTDGGGCKDTLVQNGFIKIIQADFSAAPLTGCNPLTVNFTDLSLGNPTTWNWDFGDAVTSVQQNPAHSYASSGTYTVTLTVGNGTCTDTETKTNYITVSAMPPISFTASDTVPCQLPASVTFTDNTPGATAWQWNFGDAGTSTLQNPTHVYTSQGSFNVSLIVTVANGCKDTLIDNSFIQVAVPDASFEVDTDRGCVPLTIQFTDSSTSGSPIVSWNWNFGDGNTSTSQSPSHTYIDTGQFIVKLVITNSKGCVDSISMLVYVGMKPTADFTGTPLSGCKPLSVDFTDLSSNFSNYWFWSFGDGGISDEQDPTHVYQDTGTFDVTLVVFNNGCSDTLFMPDYITVFPPKAVFSVLPGTIGCGVPFTVTLQEQSQGADTWFWDFGGGNTFSGQNPPPYTYTAQGTYTIKLVVTNTTYGCIDSTYQTIRVSDPTASFAAAGNGCQPLTVNFTDLSSSLFGVRNWQWIFGDIYSLLNVNGQGAAIPGSTSVPNGTNNSLTSGTYQNPTHIYMNPGSYTVTLIITDNLVCSDTVVVTNAINVNQLPVVDFNGTPTTGCPPLTVSFTDNSTGAVGMADWSWDFGDGGTDSVQNPVHTYYSSGVDSFTVTLIATDSNGCVSGIVRNKYIIVASPVAGFSSVTGACIGIPIAFTDTSTSQNPIVSWLWDFGDSTTDTLQNPTHTYGSSGVFTVTLVITDSVGCTDTVVKTNYITVQSVTANFGANPTSKNCPPLLVNFSDSSGAGIVAWAWQFGNGNTSTLQNPSHLYTAPGQYDVTLIVTTSLGCKDTIIKYQLINIDGPTGNFVFSPDTGCPGTIVTFDTLNVENAISFTWDFGDGAFGTGAPVSHTYTQVGTYHPFLTFQDAAGCSFGVQSPDSIVIWNIPVDAGPDITICEGDSGGLQATGGSFFSWSPASGLSSTSVSNPNASPADTTKYYVVITRSDGCQSNDSVTVFVNHNVPAADFSATSVCITDSTFFTDLTSINVDSIISWNWNFNNGESFSTDTNPEYVFSGSGNFSTTLTVTSNNGCVDSITKQNTVFPLPNANAGNDDTICINQSAQLQATGGIIYAWTINSTLSDTAIANPVASPLTSDQYVVFVTDNNNCTNSDTVNVVVNMLPTANAGNDTQICFGENITLNATGGIIYQWNSDPTLSSTTIFNPVATPVDTTTYYVTVTDANGCENSDSIEIIVNPNYPNADFSFNTVCENIATDFTDLSSMVGDTIISWNWDFDDGGAASTDTNPSYVFSTGGNFDVTLVITTNQSCTDTIIKTVVVNPLPPADAGSDDTICVLQSSQLNATGGISYSWLPTSTLNNATISNPVATPTVSTQYFVIVADANSCVDTDTVVVYVNQLPVADAGNPLQICKGDSTQLNASGGISCAWLPENSLSDTSICNPFAEPTDTTIYYVIVTDANGCSNIDSVTITVNPNLPQANFFATTVCRGKPTDFSDLSSGAGDLIQTWQWDFGDTSGTATSSAPSYTYNFYGTYLVTLVITTDKGCKDTVQGNVTVNPMPVPNFDVTDNCFGSVSVFTSTSTINPGSIVSYTWDFGDNSFGSASAVQHTYSSDAAYNVELLVVSDNGCADSITKAITIYPRPVAGFINTTACLEQATAFTDTSKVNQPATVTSWSWDFGDGSSDNSTNPSHTYNSAGNFTVVLTVGTGSANSNCTDDVSKTITVNPVPVPECSASPSETDTRTPQIQFTAADESSFFWNFYDNDGALLDTSSSQNPVYAYEDSGTYTANVTVTNVYGCSDTCDVTVRIEPYYDLLVPNAFTPNPGGSNGGVYSDDDYSNNVFFPITDFVVEYKLIIFNRWGEIVFASDDLKKGWDGYYKGKLCAQDVYVWKIKVKYADGKTIAKAGDVTLLR